MTTLQRNLLTTNVTAITRAYAQRILTAEQAAAMIRPTIPAKNTIYATCAHQIHTAALIGEPARPACPLCMVDHGYVVPMDYGLCTDCCDATARIIIGRDRMCDLCFARRWKRLSRVRS